MTGTEVPGAYCEPYLAILLGIRRELGRIDRKIVPVRIEGIEPVGEPHFLHALANLAHALLLGLAPLRRLKRHVHPRGQQAEERRDDQPGPVRNLHREKVAHLGDRGGRPDVHGQHRKHENRGEDLRNDLDHLVAAAQDDRH